MQVVDMKEHWRRSNWMKSRIWGIEEGCSIGSSGELDSLTPQHIADLHAGDPDGRLPNALTGLDKFLLAGKFDVNTVIFSGRMHQL